jgi:hypothetical protein
MRLTCRRATVKLRQRFYASWRVRLLLILRGILRPLERLSWFSVETWIAGVEPNAESVANIIRDVARESGKAGTPKVFDEPRL